MNSLSGQSLLQHISDGDIIAVNALLTNGLINLDERDQDGQTFLMVACQLGETQIVKSLLAEQSIDVNAVDNDNWTALLSAAKLGSLEILTCLLEAGANIEHRDIAGWTALMWACYKGNSEVARYLLSKEANPNVKGEHHMSCLTWAAGRGHTEIVKELLLHGAKVNTADKYGTTPLIWACRKGHVDIVDMLLADGAVVDKAGMNSWTALIVATSGGFADVVTLLLDRHPNVNAVDKDGFTALTIAAKEGYTDIANMLLQHEAYVNLPDRYGDTILIHAVKGNHLEVVRALLRKYADVDVQGVDGKTALYWAVEKSLVSVTKILLDSANMETPTKDGDTPLLRAVRCRNFELVQLLVEKGAKVSTCDRRGDNPLHVAVRGRSKRITDYLLRNPKNARLLYSKNKSGETPYQIDAGFDRSVLSQVFAARNLNADDAMQGYELYSSTVADVLSEPSLHTPITVGLFARWGSGKSYLIGPLRKEMEAFAERSMDCFFKFSLLQFFIVLLFSILIGVIFGMVFEWYIGLAAGGGLLVLQYAILGLIWYGCNRKEWDVAVRISIYLALKFQFLSLFLHLIFCNEPEQKQRETAGIRFLFTNNARMTSLVGDKFVAGMIGTLCDALEAEYGILVPRLYRIFKPLRASDHGRFKSLCCIPYFILVVLVILCGVAALVIMVVFGFKPFSYISEPEGYNYTIINSILIGLGTVVGLAILANIYTWMRAIAHLAVSTRKQVEKISQHLETLKLDGYVQLLKKEVECIGNMTRCMDAFTKSHTRLVIIVDGLDSCEQDKLLQVLDMVHVLFGGNNDVASPFVTLLAVDPHIIIKGIEHNLHSHFRDSSINGHDYLRTIVQLPFFIQSRTLPRVQTMPPPRNVSTTRADLLALNDPQTGLSISCNRQDSSMSGASYLSLTDIGKTSGGAGKGGNRRQKPSVTNMTSALNGANCGSTTLVRHPSHFDLSKTFAKSSYFSDMNPRSMKRLLNILGVTGRLLRAFNIDFNWYKLSSWINVTEQWPYRLSWIILEVEDNPDIEDTVPLKAVYERVNLRIPNSRDIDPWVEIDRNVRKLEVFLANSTPPLTVGDLRRFLPCTVNIDPYLRKLIRDLQQSNDAAAMVNDYGFHANNVNSSFDHPGWSVPPSGVGAGLSSLGSMRRVQPHHTTGTGRPQQMSNGTNQLMFNPQAPYMIHPFMQQMLTQMYDSQNAFQQQQQQPTLQPVAQPLPVHKPPRLLVGLEDKSCNKQLSSMSVDDVVHMVGCISGLNRRFLQSYSERLADSNITGTVLLSCDLNELKPVLQMSFGDWELFRSVVESLRLQEVQSSGSQQEEVTSKTTFAVGGEVYQVPQMKSAGQTNLNHGAKLLSVNSDNLSVQTNSIMGQKPRTVREDRLDANAVVAKHSSHSPTGTSLKSMNRQDSFVQEVLMEAEALHGMIQASGVGSDSSDTDSPTGEVNEGQRVISPIPEEPVLSRNPSVVSFNTLARIIPPISRQVSQDSILTTPGDRAFFVGPDNDSGESDSEEVERLSRKSSTVVRLKGSTPRSPQSSVRHDSIRSDIDLSNELETMPTPADKLPPPADKRKPALKSQKPSGDQPVRKSAMGKLTEGFSSSKAKSSTKGERKSESTTPLMNAYFPLAFDNSAERSVADRGGAKQQPGARLSPGHTSTKLASQITVPVTVHDAGLGSHAQDTRVSGLPSSRPGSANQRSSIAGSPPTSVTVTISQNVSSAQDSNMAKSSIAAPTLHSVTVSTDDVKFFIEDETRCPDVNTGNDVVVELESLSSTDVTFSNVISQASDRSDLFL